METGFDKSQLQAVELWWARTTGDHVRLRFVICLTLFLSSYLFVIDPLSERLAAARTSHREVLKRENMANELVYFADQLAIIEPRLVAVDDEVDWQNYVLAELEAAGVQLASVEPRGVKSQDGFKLVEMEINARSAEYAALVDFVDRIEHGQRLVRIEKLALVRQPDNLLLTCVLKGLVRPGLVREEAD